MTIQESIDLTQEIQTSLQAGRITPEQVKTIQGIYHKNGAASGLRALKYAEKLHYIHPYFKLTYRGFTLRLLDYDMRKISPEENRKLAVALQEALEWLNMDFRRLNDMKKEEPPCE